MGMLVVSSSSIIPQGLSQLEFELIFMILEVNLIGCMANVDCQDKSKLQMVINTCNKPCPTTNKPSQLGSGENSKNKLLNLDAGMEFNHQS